MGTVKIPIPELQALVSAVLQQAGAGAAMALATARALVLAESQGLASHGLSRVGQYSSHLRNGRANGAAQPRVLRQKGGALVVDADGGLAFAACDLAVQQAIAAARQHGVALAGVVRSHHCGVLVDHLRPVAAAGMVGLGFCQLTSGHGSGGRATPDFWHQPGGGGVSAPGCAGRTGRRL